MATLRFDHVSRTYPGMDRPAVDDFTLEIADGELLVLVGPSGCGKSTVMRMLAGVEPVNAGRIWLGNIDVTMMPARDRDIAMVFQTYALYPHMSVRENIGFHLKLEGIAYQEIDRRTLDVAEMLGIVELLDRMPSMLSGGQRQRVAMGRAVIREPSVFLMDEPLSNLDAKLRIKMRAEILALQRRLGTTMLYVTHDQTEAMTLGDRVAVQCDGRLHQCAPPMQLFDEPINEFVAGFIGSPAMNLLRGEVRAGAAEFGGLRTQLTSEQERALTTSAITIGVRPEAWYLVAEAEAEADAGERLAVTVESVEVLRPECFVTCRHVETGATVVVRADAEHDIRVGSGIGLGVRPGNVHLFDGATGLRLSNA